MRLLPIQLALLVVTACLLTGCGDSEQKNDSANSPTTKSGDKPVARSRSLDQIKASGALRVATRNAPTAYLIGRHKNATGPEVDLIRAFAKAIGVKPEFVVKNSIHGVLQALAAGDTDIAAAGLTDTKPRRQRFLFGPHYQSITPQVVCNRKSKAPKSIDDLSKANLTVIGDSSYVERLQALKRKHPGLSWQTNNKVGTEALLRRVWKNELRCTVADSNIVAVNRRYYPSLTVAFDLGTAQHLAWAMPHNATQLRDAVGSWLKKYRENGHLAAVQKRYYKYFPKFDYVDNRALVRRIENRYPKYDQLFESAAKQHDLPPLLLAAQGYQESHWDPTAKSPTGVRGIMMLTGRTAQSLGVANRLDPRESIQGGAKYLARMEAKFEDDIDAGDRAFLALAAYNLGYAHVRDAQRLTKQLGKNPDNWSDVRSALPLLAQKRYYKHLKYGYAHGGAPVIYVRRIRNYADIIDAHQ